MWLRCNSRRKCNCVDLGMSVFVLLIFNVRRGKQWFTLNVNLTLKCNHLKCMFIFPVCSGCSCTQHATDAAKSPSTGFKPSEAAVFVTAATNASVLHEALPGESHAPFPPRAADKRAAAQLIQQLPSRWVFPTQSWAIWLHDVRICSPCPCILKLS